MTIQELFKLSESEMLFKKDKIKEMNLQHEEIDFFTFSSSQTLSIIDEMAKFADQANRAAKELSTTTNNYAKASLIYYQQGLSDSEVEARTNTTIKMANVAVESRDIIMEL